MLRFRVIRRVRATEFGRNAMQGRRFVVAGCATALSVAVLAGCGGGDDSAYCSKVKSASTVLTDLEAGDVEALQQSITTLHELAEAAPDDISTQWGVYDKQLAAAEKSLTDAGLKFSDFQAISEGKLPKGVSADDVSTVLAEFQELASPTVTEATDEIRQHAQDECNVNLTGGT